MLYDSTLISGVDYQDQANNQNQDNKQYKDNTKKTMKMNKTRFTFTTLLNLHKKILKNCQQQK